MKPYMLQMVQSITEDDEDASSTFCCEFLNGMEADGDLFSHVVFSDEAIFHISGYVNHDNLRLWGTENSHTTVEHL
jgi:hypothetical protein